MQPEKWMRFLSLVGALLAGGCVTTSQQSLGPGFGDAVRTNTAAQVIDPMAGEEAMPANALDGQRVERALDRYRTEESEAEKDRLVSGVAD